MIISRHKFTETIGTDEHRIKNEVIQHCFLGIPILTTRQEVWRKGEEIPSDYRRVVQLMDNNQCVYCGTTYQKSARFAIDHIIPQIQGGSTHIFNLAFACQSCNSSKNGRTPNEASIPLVYGRFRRSENGEKAAVGVLGKQGVTIPLAYDACLELAYKVCKDNGVSVPSIDRIETHWVEYIMGFGYGEPFNTEFIACKGKIPFLY